MDNYEKQALDFARKYNVKLEVIGEPQYGRHFIDDEYNRWIFRMRLKRNGKQYTFNFGQSVAKGAEEPTMYDVLSCLTKYDPGSFEEFCREYGYDNTCECKSLKIYNAVVKEYEAVMRLFEDIIDELREIQ